METMRLRAIQQPSSVGELLDSFGSTAAGLPERTHRIYNPSELPPVLQRLVIQAANGDREWAAWSDDHRLWLFTGEMSLALSRERGNPVLDVKGYGESGQLVASGSYVCDRQGRWQRCAD